MGGVSGGAEPHTSPRLRALLRASTRRALRHAAQSGADRSIDQQLEKSLAALDGNRLDEALRHIDRAWRTLPEESGELAAIYGRLLCLEGRDHAAAWHLLQRVLTLDADLAALRVHTLLRLNRVDEARHSLHAALNAFCVLPGGLLAPIASEILHHSGTRAAGWIGRGSGLEFVGELLSLETASALQIRRDGGAEFIQPIKASLRGGLHTFRFKHPRASSTATLQVMSHGVGLLGGDCRAVPDFGLDGRAWNRGRALHGWVRLNWMDTRPVTLRFEDEHGLTVEAGAQRYSPPDGRWNFEFDLKSAQSRGCRIRISARLPNGDWHDLPDTPLLLEDAVRLSGRKKPALSRWRQRVAAGGRQPAPRRRVQVDVIIPVYRGRVESLQCIDAALATAGHARIVVVDDATDDPGLAAALDELEAAGRITLLRNAANQGFVASVNRALARGGARDAVLLNSDTVVFGDWLERLQDAAYGGPSVGTATPFSNNGSIASYPRAAADAVSIDEAAALHRLANTTHAGRRIEIPVGVGFCLYVRRDCFRQVGEFEASVFGKGYGEETDFCLRARDLGWSHNLAADVFVYHAGARSFGARREALLERSRRLLNLRHPGFDPFIADFLRADPLAVPRRMLDEHRLSEFQGRFVLLVTLAVGGGVARFVTERCRAIRAQGMFSLILRPRAVRDSRRCELTTDALDLPNLLYDIPADLPALTATLRGLSLHAIEIQHFLHVDARVIEAVRGLGIPYEVVIHDYAWICPRVTLIDAGDRYCGEPAIAVCEACIKRNGSELGEKLSVSALRRRSALWLSQAAHVTAPSADAAERMQRYVNVNIGVRPHASRVVATPPLPRLSPNRRIRVALIGAIGVHKGYRVLLGCARDARTRRLPLEFVVIGHTESDATLLKTGRVFITGRYVEGEASHLIERERPDLVFMASVWPETWCFALDEALTAQTPIVAFELGAIAERLLATGIGTLLPLHATPGRINDTFLELAGRMPSGKVDIMLKSEEKTMNKAAVSTPPHPDALSASIQILPLTAGLYLFSVKTAVASLKPGNGQLQLPALHVGLGPGVNSQQVEFIAGPTTDGAWLFAKNDCLVIKVSGSGTTLVLTSVRGPGGEALAIVVERLDARSDAPAASLTATALPGPAAGAAPLVPMSPKPPQAPAAAAAESAAPVPLQIRAHIRTRGDMSFTDAPWAGRVAPGLWVESFAVKPLQRLAAQDVEYKGLTGSGFETPWLSDAAMCGTQGMSVPLVGFAIRLKPSSEAAAFECEYSGYFKSGAIVGPLRNGAPCRSTVANDPLEGLQVHIRGRSPVARLVTPRPAGARAAGVEPGPAAKAGPSFGRYRDAQPGHGAAAAPPRAGGVKPKPAAEAAPAAKRKRSGSAAPKRPSTRRT